MVRSVTNSYMQDLDVGDLRDSRRDPSLQQPNRIRRFELPARRIPSPSAAIVILSPFVSEDVTVCGPISSTHLTNRQRHSFKMAGHGYEKVSLLSGEADGDRAEKGSKHFSPHVTCLAMKSLAVGSTSSCNGNWTVPNELSAPASSAVSYSIQRTDPYAAHASRFIGEPRLGLYQAWSNLLRCALRSLTPSFGIEHADLVYASDQYPDFESNMRKMNKTSVALRDGSGFLGYLEVHHLLHCLGRAKYLSRSSEVVKALACLRGHDDAAPRGHGSRNR
nr:hypothetical protein CFP56_09586 [Quercus suber]